MTDSYVKDLYVKELLARAKAAGKRKVTLDHAEHVALLAEVQMLRRALIEMTYLALGARQLADGRHVLADVASVDEPDPAYLEGLRRNARPVQAILSRFGGTLTLDTSIVPLKEYLQAVELPLLAD